MNFVDRVWEAASDLLEMKQFKSGNLCPQVITQEIINPENLVSFKINYVREAVYSIRVIQA